MMRGGLAPGIAVAWRQQGAEAALAGGRRFPTGLVPQLAPFVRSSIQAEI